jgi:hypothetical protein
MAICPAALLARPRPAQAQVLECPVGAEEERARRFAVKLDPLRAGAPPEAVAAPAGVGERDFNPLAAGGTEGILELRGGERHRRLGAVGHDSPAARGVELERHRLWILR